MLKNPPSLSSRGRRGGPKGHGSRVAGHGLPVAVHGSLVACPEPCWFRACHRAPLVELVAGRWSLPVPRPCSACHRSPARPERSRRVACHWSSAAAERRGSNESCRKANLGGQGFSPDVKAHKKRMALAPEASGLKSPAAAERGGLNQKEYGPTLFWLPWSENRRWRLISKTKYILAVTA